MNYWKIYKNLCERGLSRIYDKSIHQRHHIIPKCMGGVDDKDNLTVLFIREHYLCHKILVELYPENHKLKYAFKMMLGTMMKKGLHFSARDYERARKGMRHSETAKQKLRQRVPYIRTKESITKSIQTRRRNGKNIPWNKGLKLGPQNKDLIERRTIPLIGRKHSEEWKIKATVNHRKAITARLGFLLQCDIDGNVIAKYESIQDIDLMLFKIENLREAIVNIKRKGRSGYYKGYYWRYERDGDIDIKARVLTSKKNHTPIKYRKTNALIAE